MNVLITGGTGFIGSRLALRCLDGGYAVRVLGQENTEAESFNRRMVTERGAHVLLASITDREILGEAVKGVDVVYHLAAVQHEVNASDQRFRDVNVTGTGDLLEASAKAGVKRFVHGSTIGVYGSRMNGVIDEDSPAVPDNIYGRTKLDGEKTVLSFRERIPVVIVRIPETYGPGDRRLLKLFRAVRKGVFPLIGDGRNLHHLIHIDDLIDAFFLAASRPEAVGEIFVVAGKEPVTTNVMVATVAEAVGGRVPGFRAPLSVFLLLAAATEAVCLPFGIKPPIYRRRMDFFRKSYSFSLGKAEKVLGFEPKVGIREGFSATASWYRDAGLL